MTTNEGFELWYEHICSWEGKGLNIDVKDVDGDGVATNHGIRYDTWVAMCKRWGTIKGDEVKKQFYNMHPDQHKAVARWFWEESGANYIKEGAIAAFMAENFWGSGYYGLRDMQRAVNKISDIKIKVDGKPRSKTAEAINKLNSIWLFDVMVKQKEQRLKNIAKKKDSKDPSKDKSKNLKGWLKRLYDGYGGKQLGFVARFGDKIGENKNCPTCGQKLQAS